MIVFTMEHSREFYESVISVIDYLNPYTKEIWDVSPEKGEELAGDYWWEIGRMLCEDYHLGNFAYGGFHIGDRPRLASLRKDCEHEIEKIDMSEQDRLLSNEESVYNIKYGKKGYDLAQKSSKWSKASIIISAIVAAGQLTQWIIMLLQYLRQ